MGRTGTKTIQKRQSFCDTNARMLKTQVPSYFKKRREKLFQKNPEAVFVFPSNSLLIRNDDVHYPFRQDSNFYYLTGFEEPDAFLVLVPERSKPGSHRSVLFVQDRNPEREIWDGERYGAEGARKVFGVDETYVNTEFDQKFLEYLKHTDTVFYRWGNSAENDPRVFGLIDRYRQSLGRSGRSAHRIEDTKQILGEMRLFKSTDEIELLRKAAAYSAAAHTEMMKQVKPGMGEAQVAAMIEFEMIHRGCQRLGYGSIVAGGKNATCLHYVANNDTLRDGELLLIDAGGEYDYFTADITRVLPVGRSFSAAQAEIYDLVLASQMACLSIIKPGIPYSKVHETASTVLAEGLLSMGLLKGTAKDVIESGAIKRFFPHGTGHFLGMDVHDAGLYRVVKPGSTPPVEESRTVEAGMVFTVEPGLYCQPGDREVPEKYRNIGVRIEDDIVVTSQGCEILTSGVPKERSEIEALRR